MLASDQADLHSFPNVMLLPELSVHLTVNIAVTDKNVLTHNLFRLANDERHIDALKEAYLVIDLRFVRDATYFTILGQDEAQGPIADIDSPHMLSDLLH